MRILHIISGDLWGGAESIASSIIGELSLMPDVEVFVILFNYGKLEERLSSYQIPVKVIAEDKMSHAFLLLKAYQYVRNIKPDIIHTHKHKENVIGSIISLLTRIPSIRTTHGDSESNIGIKDGLKYLYKILNRFSGRYIQKKIVAVSSELNSKLKSLYPPEKVITIQNGIRIDNKLKEISSNKKKTTVAIVCRLVPVKRVDIFLRIAHILIKNKPDAFDFLIFGDGPLYGELMQLSNNIGVAQNIKFMGFVDEMNEYYPKIDILLITSDHEGLPMNLLEAILYGIPVVSHDVGDVRKVLCNGKCGELIKNQDPVEYAEAIVKIINDNKVKETYTQNAIQNVSISYNLKRTAKKYFNLYSSLIE